MVKEQRVPIGEIATSRFQGRRTGDISALAKSIKKNGLINPIHVWDTGSGLELLCGQRRLGAHVANDEAEIRAYVYSGISNTKAAVGRAPRRFTLQRDRHPYGNAARAD